MKQTNAQIVAKSIERGYILENEINLLKKRLNAGESDEFMEAIYDNGGIELSEEQNAKGYAWLLDKWQTPTGKERKNNPFGYREMEALKDFSHFKIAGFFDAGWYGFHSWMPIYDVYAKDGYGFQYIVKGGQPYIIG